MRNSDTDIARTGDSGGAKRCSVHILLALNIIIMYASGRMACRRWHYCWWISVKVANCRDTTVNEAATLAA